jgi:ABC-type antimicrobial peptide transport system permease subunit
LILAAVGIYGVLAYSVTQRTNEIGIRMALGAQPGGILHLIMVQSLQMVFIGLGIGLFGAFVLTRVLGNLLYEVKARDPITFLAVAILLAGVALAAAFIPGRRASRLDPVVALRAG